MSSVVDRGLLVARGRNDPGGVGAFDRQPEKEWFQRLDVRTILAPAVTLAGVRSLGTSTQRCHG